jgi:hypothetical protein
VNSGDQTKGTAMSGKFNPYDLKAFLQAIIAFVFLFGLLVATAAVAVS